MVARAVEATAVVGSAAETVEDWGVVTVVAAMAAVDLVAVAMAVVKVVVMVAVVKVVETEIGMRLEPCEAA